MSDVVYVVIHQFAKNGDIVWMEQVDKVFRKESDASDHVAKMMKKKRKDEKLDYKIEKFRIL